MSDAVVIIGSGLAGYNVARELRKLDANVPLVVISRDHAGFYSKPMLSNALASKKTPATLVMKDAAKMAGEVNARVIGGAQVSRIDAAAKAVHLSNGEVVAYRDLVLALGADPIRLPLQGDAADTVLSVNDLEDFAKFSEALDSGVQGGPVKRVAILGAGLIGCEFANDLLARDIAPTVLDLAERVLPRLLPPEASARLQDKLQAAGAQFRFGVGATAVDRVDGALRLTLSDGSTLDTDLLLSAAFEVDAAVLVEHFARGREVTCGVVDLHAEVARASGVAALAEHAGAAVALPPTEILAPADAFYTYEARYAPGRSQHACPAPLPASVAERVQRVAVGAHRALGVRDLSRVDFVVGDLHDPDAVTLLEVNTLPGFTPTSLYPEAAGVLGLALPTLCDLLARSAHARGTTPRNIARPLPK